MPPTGAHRRRRKALPAPKRAAVAAIARKTVMRMAEKKFIEVDLNGIGVDTTTANTPLTGIIRGFTDESRNGDEVIISKIELRLEFRSDVTANLGSSIRVILFQWHPTDGTAPTVANVLLAGTITRLTKRGYLVDGRKNFTILTDRQIDVSTVAGTNFMQDLHITKTKGFRKKIDYNGTAVTGLNNIYLLMVSDFATGTTEPICFGGSRFTYIDP